MAQGSTTTTIEWKDIYSEAVKISSYEGRSSVTPSGESDYSNVLITDQDKYLIVNYISQSIAVTEQALGSLVSGTTQTDAVGNVSPVAESNGSKTGFTFIYDSARVSKDMLGKMITEAISSHLMMLWLSERKSSRVEFYNTLFTQMINSIKTRLTRKSKPSLDINY